MIMNWHLKDVISKDLCSLINLSYETRTFPSSLKHATIKAIYKNKGSPNDPEFYRPISILNVVSKVFERSATNQIVDFLEAEQKFYKGQHAYRRQHSTTTCLVEVTEFIHSKIDNGNIVGLASTDLSKAFDTLSHNQLIRKLQKMDFQPSAIEWIRSYLSNRTQQTKFNQLISDTATVEAGVPQGSILGPVLFIAFTADLSTYIPECVIKAYADDTQFMVEGSTVEEVNARMEAVIQKAQQWYTSNCLKINPTKTEVMFFGRKRTDDQPVKISIFEDNTEKFIYTKDTMKLLGVILDSNLTWGEHIKKLKARVCRTTANLARTSAILPLRSRRQLYDALVVPHLSYCDVVWDGTLVQHEKSLQSVANFGAKSLLGVKKNSSATDALNKLNMLPLKERRRVHMGVFVHKLSNGNGSTELMETFQRRTLRNHRYCTRAIERGDTATVAHNTTRSERGTVYRAFKNWNEIPPHVREIPNTSTFKKTYQKHLLSKL